MRATDSQQKRVIKFIDSHGSITRLQAYNKLGITELPKRVSELRRLGFPIGDTWVEVLNRYGEKTRVKSYFNQGEEPLKSLL